MIDTLAMARRLPYAGIVGNGRTCALIDARGRIGWLCLPTFAQFPVFASLLDPKRGGCLELGLRTNGRDFWSGEYGYCEQMYLDGSNVLTTIWKMTAATLSIRDSMPWGEMALVREIEIEPHDRNPFTILVRLRPTSVTPASTRFRVDETGIEISETRCPAQGHLSCHAVRGEETGRQAAGQELELEFAATENRLTLVLAYRNEKGAETGGESRSYPDSTTCYTADRAWLANAASVTLPDKNLERVFERSLLALRLLTYEPTGAVLAAATGSFPSEPGGHSNWDFRYCWVRDGCYTAQAYDLAGLHKEAEGIYRFLLERQDADGQWSSPLFAIESRYPTTEEEIEGLCGPGGEVPVRFGNGAALQAQHDSPGNVLSGVYDHCIQTGTAELAERYWPQLAAAAEWCCEHWAEPEAGIWERRERDRQWVYGRAMCYAALRDGTALASVLGIESHERWLTTASEIASTLPDAAWSEEKECFLRACGEASIVDVSVLALVFEGLVRPDDPRLRQTVSEIQSILSFGRAFRRDEEDVRYPFYLATAWVIRSLQMSGDYDGAYAYLTGIINGTSDLDLMAEYFDPITSRQYGNFPQAYSHEQLVKTIAAMLWNWDGKHLVLFPAIPSVWLVPGNSITVQNIPLAGRRGQITLTVLEDELVFTSIGITGCEVIVPPRYSTWRWRLVEK